MTPLPAPFADAPNRSLAAWSLVLLLPGAISSGCLGRGDGDDAGPVETFSVFLAALGTPTSTASATVSSIGLTFAGTGETRFLELGETLFDLAALAQTGQAPLAATSADVNGTAAVTIVSFSSLKIDDVALANVKLEVPFEYAARPPIEVTVTIDLDATKAAGEPKLQSLVVDEGTERLGSITGTELELGGRTEVTPLATPTIFASPGPGSNDTYPSFEVNSPILFTAEIDESADAEVREVFWTFSDGTTTTGREVEHTFHDAGPETAAVVAEGTRGQQARASLFLDIYFTAADEGNVGVGTGGTGAVEDRDVKNHPIDIPGPLSSLELVLVQGPSGNLCAPPPAPPTCAPSNVFVELYDAGGELAGEDRSAVATKRVNVTALSEAGEWIVRVLADQGVAVGYTFAIEVHYVGLCPSGVTCPGAPDDGHDHEH